MIHPDDPHEVHPTLRGFGRTGPESRWDYVFIRKPPKGRGCWVRFCRGVRSPSSKHRVCSKCLKRMERLNAPLESVFRTLRDNAKRRGKVFDLTLDFFRQFVAENGYLDARGKSLGCLHIDRKNPLLGYTPDNIQVLESGENSTKGAGFDKARWAAERRGKPFLQQPELYEDENVPF